MEKTDATGESDDNERRWHCVLVFGRLDQVRCGVFIGYRSNVWQILDKSIDHKFWRSPQCPTTSPSSGLGFPSSTSRGISIWCWYDVSVDIRALISTARSVIRQPRLVSGASKYSITLITPLLALKGSESSLLLCEAFRGRATSLHVCVIYYWVSDFSIPPVIHNY